MSDWWEPYTVSGDRISTISVNHNLEEFYERHMLDEIAFWGIHDFREHPMIMGCSRCGWGFNEGVHTGRVAAY